MRFMHMIKVLFCSKNRFGLKPCVMWLCCRLGKSSSALYPDGLQPCSGVKLCLLHGSMA
jgi:hypothetical protein